MFPHFQVNIIASFLSDRSQVVKYKNVYSDSLPISCGVLQGTLLVPLLFLVMINNLANESADRWKLVDDMWLLEKCRRNIKSSATEILEDVASKAAWSKMKVNSHKSHIMTFSFIKSKPSFITPIPNKINKKINSQGSHWLAAWNGRLTFALLFNSLVHLCPAIC